MCVCACMYVCMVRSKAYSMNGHSVTNWQGCKYYANILGYIVNKNNNIEGKHKIVYNIRFVLLSIKISLKHKLWHEKCSKKIIL